jgi:hypothetical protein
MKQIIQKVTGNDEKDAWQFFGQITAIHDATNSYLEGKVTERRLMIILLDCLLKMDAICKSRVQRLAREKRTQIEKKSQETVQRLLRKKRG